MKETALMSPARRGSRTTTGRKTTRPSAATPTPTDEEGTELTRRTTIYLKEETWKSMKLMTVETGESVSAYIERLIDKDVKRVQKKLLQNPKSL